MKLGILYFSSPVLIWQPYLQGLHQNEFTPLIPYPGGKWKARYDWRPPFQTSGRFRSLQLSHLSEVNLKSLFKILPQLFLGQETWTPN